MIIDDIKVNPVVRVVVNLLVAATIGGSVAYLSWRIGAPQWLAIALGVAAVILIAWMWLGSMEDNANA